MRWTQMICVNICIRSVAGFGPFLMHELLSPAGNTSRSNNGRRPRAHASPVLVVSTGRRSGRSLAPFRTSNLAQQQCNEGGATTANTTHRIVYDSAGGFGESSSWLACVRAWQHGCWLAIGKLLNRSNKKQAAWLCARIYMFSSSALAQSISKSKMSFFSTDPNQSNCVVTILSKLYFDVGCRSHSEPSIGDAIILAFSSLHCDKRSRIKETRQNRLKTISN